MTFLSDNDGTPLHCAQREMAEVLPQIVWTAQPDGTVDWINSEFRTYTGLADIDPAAGDWILAVHPDERGPTLQLWAEACARGQPYRTEFRLWSATEGRWRAHLIDARPHHDAQGRLVRWFGIATDIQDLKSAEEEIRLNQERFRLVTLATKDIIWDWDLATGTQWANENLKTVLGYDSTTKDRAIESWTDRIHPEDREWVVASLNAQIAGSEPFWSVEYRYRHADGHYLTVIDRSFVIRDDEGKAVRMLGSLVDVSAQRELESRLRQAQKLEVVGQLTGGVAHDFNNLLTVIMGSAEILSEALGDQQHLQILADMTIDAAGRGADLTNQLLTFSRKQALQPQVLDVGAVIQGMEHLLRRTLPASINIRIGPIEGLWRAEIDRSQLESALLNLALNARDAMPAGGHLTVEMSNAELDDDYVASEQDLRPGQYVMIAVSDTGQGMAPAVLRRAFEPFFTTKDVGKGKGSGLGLSTVYGFVKQSGGHIRIYSEPGEGTCVRLYFPHVHEADAPPQPDVTGNHVAGGDETILVVEDDQLVREHLVARLIGLGYTVDAAETGPQALDMLKGTCGPDLLLTDIVLPDGMNGRMLADAARSLRPGLNVLFTSGYSEDAIVHNGRLDPGVELLSKPYRREQLAAKIRKVLDRG